MEFIKVNGEWKFQSINLINSVDGMEQLVTDLDKDRYF